MRMTYILQNGNGGLLKKQSIWKKNHLHTVRRQRWQQHQQGGLDFARPITYRLWEGKGGNNISKEVWTLQDQSLTPCEKAKVATTSTRRSGLCKTNHLQPVGRQRWQQHQQGGLDFARPITYILWEGKGGNNINKEVWTLQDQSLTTCGKAKAATTSVRRSGLCKTNHLQPVGRQGRREGQEGGLDFARPITYILWEGKGGNNISKEVWTLQDQSLTYCGKAKVATTSARRSGLCKTNHLHTVGRQRWQQHQQGGLDFARPITYILWEGKGGNNISKEV